MFIWKTSSILQQIKQHLPSVYDEIIKVQPLWKTQELKKAIASAYERTASISIDYGVLEKSDQVCTVEGDFGWNDIGTWAAIHGVSDKDTDNNVLQGDVVAVDSKDVFVYSPDKLVAVVGLNDIVIVETSDALLVCSKEKAQDVKRVVDLLEADGRREFL
jgi:mannose-1-phosphate guanylyltransferase